MAMALQSQIKACSFVLSLALVSCLANGAISGRVGLRDRRLLLDEAAGTDFDITKNGAKADDDTFDNAQAIMHAWTSACESGSAARVVVPQGTYMTSPVVFQGPCDGPITFELQGNLKASTDVSLYADGNWVLFEYVDGLLVTGTGTFDGQGASAWKYNDCDHNSDCMALPDSIKLHQVKNSVVETVTSLNAMYFHFHVVYCTNVTLSKLTITAPSNSPNTDGIHISNSQFITVTETNIGTGDDCVSIGQGVNNLTVSQVTCGPGHGISVGSLGKYKKEKDVSGILVINCTLSNTTNGARIKSYPASPPSQASDIVFQDIIIDNVKNPIIIDQKYGSHKSDPSKVHISDVHFRNFKGSSTSNVAVNLMCSSLVPCDGVELVDIDLSYSGAGDNTTIVSSCFNAQVRTSGTQNPDPCPDSAAAPTPVSAPAPVSDLASVSSPAPAPV